MEPMQFPFVDPPERSQFQPCIKCGLCLESCPTFQETGRELESPRGRVQLIAAVARGTVPLTAPKVAHTLFSCLDCRACEVACPSGVPIGSLIERGRAQVVASQKTGRIDGSRPAVSRSTRWALRHLLPYPKRLKTAGRLLASAQRLRLTTGPGRHLLPIGMQRVATSLPTVRRRRAESRSVAPVDPKRPRVGVFLGCVMEVLFKDANEATVRVLQHNTLTPVIPDAQVCCGALAIHAGEREQARDLARKNIDAFLAADVDYVATNAGGCGAAMLEYPEWLADDPEYHDRAIQLQKKVRDIATILDQEGWAVPRTAQPTIVTYQASCHLQNVMHAGDAPIRILQSLPGVDFRPMADAARCCGSAGIYNLTHPAMAEALLVRKMNDVPEETETIVTGNPGCWLQLLHGVQAYRPNIAVRHLVQLLDDAYQADGDSEPRAMGASE